MVKNKRIKDRRKRRRQELLKYNETERLYTESRLDWETVEGQGKIPIPSEPIVEKKYYITSFAHNIYNRFFGKSTVYESI